MGAELMRQLAIWSIRSYQVLLSPLVGGACRFSPSCSRYAVEAITRYGARRGGWLAVKRLVRCHPFGSHGWDPVPDVDPRLRDNECLPDAVCHAPSMCTFFRLASRTPITSPGFTWKEGISTLRSLTTI